MLIVFTFEIVSTSVSHAELNGDNVSKPPFSARTNDSNLLDLVHVVLQRQRTQGEDASNRFSLPLCVALPTTYFVITSSHTPISMTPLLDTTLICAIKIAFDLADPL